MTSGRKPVMRKTGTSAGGGPNLKVGLNLVFCSGLGAASPAAAENEEASVRLP